MNDNVKGKPSLLKSETKALENNCKAIKIIIVNFNIEIPGLELLCVHH